MSINNSHQIFVDNLPSTQDGANAGDSETNETQAVPALMELSFG